MMTKDDLDKKLIDNPFSILWEIICQDICQDISEGRLHPGDAISEAQVAKQMGISRSPVKRALDKLMSSGILVKSGRKVIVNDLTSQDYQNLYEARRILEENAAGIAAKTISPERLEELKMCLSDMEKSINGNDVDMYRKYEREFHRIIIRSTENRYIIDMYDYLSQDLARYQFTLAVRMKSGTVTGDYLKKEYLKHKRICDAIAAGFAIEARDAVATDMQTMFRTISQFGVQ